MPLEDARPSGLFGSWVSENMGSASTKDRRLQWAKDNPEAAQGIMDKLGLLMMALRSSGGAMKGNAIAHEASGGGLPAIMGGRPSIAPAGVPDQAMIFPETMGATPLPQVATARNQSWARKANNENIAGSYGSLSAALAGPEGPMILARIRQRIAEEARKSFTPIPGGKE